MTHEEVKVWADEASKAPVQRAMICSISHCWETREHPDPCGYQLQQMVNTISLQLFSEKKQTVYTVVIVMFYWMYVWFGVELKGLKRCCFCFSWSCDEKLSFHKV